MKPRGPDSQKRKHRKSRGPCPNPIWSIHQQIAWYGDEGEFRPVLTPSTVTFRQGTTAKIEAMRKRAERGEDLFCEGDVDARD